MQLWTTATMGCLGASARGADCPAACLRTNEPPALIARGRDSRSNGALAALPGRLLRGVVRVDDVLANAAAIVDLESGALGPVPDGT